MQPQSELIEGWSAAAATASRRPLVMDVGAGSGAFSMHAAARGFNVAAVSDVISHDLLFGGALLAGSNRVYVAPPHVGVRLRQGPKCEPFWREL